MGARDPLGTRTAMIAHSSAVVAPGGVLQYVRSAPPLTLRQVHAESPLTCALCLIGSAAGPLADDDLRLDIEALPGSRAIVSATGASIAQGREGQPPSSMRTRLVIGEGARIAGDTGALVVAGGAAVNVDVDITMASGGQVEWRELIVLGRSGEPSGQALLRWNVMIGGRPVLRQSLDVNGRGADSPMLLGGHRVIASMLISAPDLSARTVVLHRDAVATRMSEHAVLLTVLADDVVDATLQLDELRTRVVMPHTEPVIRSTAMSGRSPSA